MADDTNNLAIFDFKLEAKNILNSLDSLYRTREREIRLTFSKLFDNVPSEIKDTPISECLEAYLNFVKSEDSYLKMLKAEKKTKEPSKEEKPAPKKVVEKENKEVSIVTIIDDSVVAEDEVAETKVQVQPDIKQIDVNESNLDFENFSKFNNLTSTVKKPYQNSKPLTSKLNMMLSEEIASPGDSRGEETYYNAEETDACGQTKVVKSNEMTIVSEALHHSDYALKLIYYLQDGTEARVNLKDLKSVCMDKIHPACLNELKMAIINNS